jgi:Mg-dependent DNase
MIDSHCHLDHEPLAQNIQDVLSRCKSVGIEKVLTISTTLSGFSKILEFVEKMK